MHPTQLAVLGATLLVAGSRTSAPRPAPAERIVAQVRFANHLTGKRTWSLASNGTVIFPDVVVGTTTRYIATTDTLSTLTLRRDASDSVFATTNFPFVGGSFYTVTATYANGGDRPVLAVERDVPPRDTMP
jgi:hypothetical protein